MPGPDRTSSEPGLYLRAASAAWGWRLELGILLATWFVGHVAMALGGLVGLGGVTAGVTAALGAVPSLRHRVVGALQHAARRRWLDRGLVAAGLKSANGSGPRLLSLDPVPAGLQARVRLPLGVDEDGQWVQLSLPERNLLTGGEPGAGKSVALSVILATAALDPSVTLTLLDGKQVELAGWAPCADRFVGLALSEATAALDAVRVEMDRRYDRLLAAGRRKLAEDDPQGMHVVVIDELAFYTAGPARERARFADLLRDIVARGRAAGVVVVAATQKPSHDVVPTTIRDLFSYRLAMRCTTNEASETILGSGWASQGWSAATIDPAARGSGCSCTRVARRCACGPAGSTTTPWLPSLPGPPPPASATARRRDPGPRWWRAGAGPAAGRGAPGRRVQPPHPTGRPGHRRRRPSGAPDGDGGLQGPPGRRLPGLRPPLPGGRLAAGGCRAARRQGRARGGRRPPPVLRDAHRPQLRRRPPARRDAGPLPATEAAAPVPPRTAAVVRCPAWGG